MKKLQELIENHPSVFRNIARKQIITLVIQNKEALVATSGVLATWTPSHSTGRRPKDTYIVRHEVSAKKIDWSSPANHPLTPDVFDQLYTDAMHLLSQKKKLYVSDRVIGADVSYALPVTVVSDTALTTLFTYNMFRPIPARIEKSRLKNKAFTLLVLPHDKGEIDKRHQIVIAMDVDRQIGLVLGSSYLGTVKKLLFTVMNYLLLDYGVLPLHCAANQNKKGETSLFLGLSGTGKTTLSTDPKRALIGDDEHLWSEEGIANYEYGCYAKLLHINPKKEPEIYKAVFTKRHHLAHGCIIENALMYPDGFFDLSDERLTPNSRVSYPISYVENVKADALGNHPQTIIFLTADAYGVLPPVAKLTFDQAVFWFLMGYTSKLAGTETGIAAPVASFSRFFGEPFMPRTPHDYMKLFGEKIQKHRTNVFLVNTGWTGGPYGVGSRFDIVVTRKIVEAALAGSLENVTYTQDKRFHFFVPQTCLAVDARLLNPKNTWGDKAAYEKQADMLAHKFEEHFEKAYGKSHIEEQIRSQCPTKATFQTGS